MGGVFVEQPISEHDDVLRWNVVNDHGRDLCLQQSSCRLSPNRFNVFPTPVK